MSVSVPPNREFIVPTFDAFKNLGGEGTNHDIYDEVIRTMGLSEEQLAIPHKTAISMVTNRIQWAMFKLKQVGILDNPKRAFYVLTDEAWSLNSVDPDQVQRAYHLRRKAQNQRQASASQTDSRIGIPTKCDASSRLDSPSEVLEPISEELPIANSIANMRRQLSETGPLVALDDLVDSHRNWRNDLYEVLQQLSPPAFERFFALIFSSEGVDRVETANALGGGAIEGTMVSSGFLSFRVAFKFVGGNRMISAQDFDDFRRSVRASGADKGLYITTGKFSHEALRDAGRGQAPAVELIDGELFLNKLKERSLGVDTEQVLVERVVVNREFFNSL